MEGGTEGSLEDSVSMQEGVCNLGSMCSGGGCNLGQETGCRIWECRRDCKVL